MKVREILRLAEIQPSLDASEELEFKGRNRDDVYEWVNHALGGSGTTI